VRTSKQFSRHVIVPLKAIGNNSDFDNMKVASIQQSNVCALLPFCYRLQYIVAGTVQFTQTHYRIEYWMLAVVKV